MSIEIQGIAELSQLLTEIAPRAAKRYLSRAAEPAAQVVIDAAQATVPVAVGVLEDSLGWERTWDSTDAETTLTMAVGPRKGVFWGSQQEFGWKDVPGQHWLQRAWESSKDKCLNVFATELTGLLQDLENRKG